MSRQERSKQAHELGCLKTAQECLVGFPEGEIRPGDDPPDCYVAVPGCGDVAFELTEQVDRVAVRAAALAKRFIEEARGEFFRKYPEYRTGWRMSLSPGDIFETIAAEPDNTCAWAERKDSLIERFVSAVAGEVTERHSFRWRVSGEPIWTFSTCERVQPQELTSMDFYRGWAYHYKSRDRIENEFGRDVTFNPDLIQERISKKVSGLQRYECRPAYLLISASLFPRSVRNAGSFAVLKTPKSIVGRLFDIGGFTAVFLHDFDSRSYRIGKDGRALKVATRASAPTVRASVPIIRETSFKRLTAVKVLANR